MEGDLLIAGLCFITPAVIITGFFAWLAYKSYGQLPQVRPFIYGIKPRNYSGNHLGYIYPLAKKSIQTIELGIIGAL